MLTDCPHISSILKLLELSGNEVEEITGGWSNVTQDLRMKFPLTLVLKEKILVKEPSLEYWKYKGSPHNAADEGFKCKIHRVSISFPLR